MARKRAATDGGFAAEAERILALPIFHPVNELGGYGAGGEVIYLAHPSGCPCVLVDSRPGAAATFMSNGSAAFEVRLAGGMEVQVLAGSFEPVEKREIDVHSSNVWLDLGGGPGGRRIASLMNPRIALDLEPAAIRIVKLGDPLRAMWYCASFRPGGGVACESAVRLALADSPHGPVLTRRVYVRNTGRRRLDGRLWTYFHLRGTQEFVYNKPLWYDSGLPASLRETVVASPVPQRDALQIKRVSTRAEGARAVAATCDYAGFVGDSAASAAMPEAVRRGGLLPGGAGRRLNRFSTPTIAANGLEFSLAPGEAATVSQALLYVTDGRTVERFRRLAASRSGRYRDVTAAFRAAAKAVIAATGEPPLLDPSASTGEGLETPAAPADPAFHLLLPHRPVAALFANSVWTTVEELYRNCRAHGARLADGIEVGTRDRAQDMWPMMKADPARVRADLLHALGLMYVTAPRPPRPSSRRPMTLREKLYGMFPRQFPSRWLDRSAAVFNDNRPYADSPLWLIDAAAMYIRETGDAGILAERVGSASLTDPDHPVGAGIVGAEETFAVAEVLCEALECFRRHADDSPYGCAQILYGDWCDPVDMFGTSKVGDPATRGAGRGVGIRLSAHLFAALVETIDLLSLAGVRAGLASAGIDVDRRVAALKPFTDRLRRNIVRWAWEEGPSAGFIGAIHELARDGSRPDYRSGLGGYTLGSMKGRDFDRAARRELLAQAYCLPMLTTRRDYLQPVEGADEMVRGLLATTDRLLYDPRLGLRLYSRPVANNATSRRLVGRMGIVPAGCAENGEYHHGQMFMHCFRLAVPGQPSAAWRQFTPTLSAMRDASIAGPFETPCTSYASDAGDPHFGAGMYFGLSGSVDWIVQIVQRMAGVELALHDPDRPDVAIRPALPADLGGELTFSRLIHKARPGGGTVKYRQIPLTVKITRAASPGVRINGKPAEKAEIADVGKYRRIVIEIASGSR